ncbi:HEPN domain-containing protein [Aquirufa rosea]|uniref:HEPN domain-containing protein n=1 Tax=Aquirufa rosea TaxID=2509241 RepID=A0A4Q1BZQ6_9BACT|nr:HEPN domain-containing protein [Aquirufa rosea]RXK49638.1 HEPN domain-containing protein [Aquirufa rosea]
MQSFRSEIENPVVEKDILDLAKKIAQFRAGEIHEEKFRSLRLARGVYGQRQQGVQMVRIKLPYGKIKFNQWKRIADISDEYSTGNLHLTTRQDIQIHFVSLDRTPELWAKLEQDDITLREACGNTVRNITASPTSGIDPKELFDVSAHADTAFRYLLRNPICQEMGRKVKISFSNTDEDTSLAYLHDMGFIPKIQEGVRGFKVVVGGGLGAQPMLAYTAFEFLAENKIIPFMEAVLRVFDRHGERNSRHKARMKFLIQKIGFEAFMDLVQAETKALKNQIVEIPSDGVWEVALPNKLADIPADNSAEYQTWLSSNTFEQKQAGYFGVYVRILNGNISSDTSRSLMKALEGYVGDDVRITINQGLMLKFVPQQNLPYVYQVLKDHQLAAPGANSVANITACPGTDTCNLAISDSTHITSKLEEVISQDFPDLILDNQMKIKISGCMNACGQHSMASIGFHGSSLKAPDKRVLPALQVLLGGATLGNGEGKIADKVIKVPSKRGPEVLRVILNNYEENSQEGEYFHEYYDRQGEKYFYALLKPIADLQTLEDDDFIDWGAAESFQTEIGVGECASVIIDLVATLLFESEEKYDWCKSALEDKRWADAIYHAYSVFISAAKALLLDKSVQSSTQHAVITKFDEHYVQSGEFDLNGKSFTDLVLQINQHEPSEEFAKTYAQQALIFLETASSFRQSLASN